MKALTLEAAGQKLSFKEIESPVAAQDEVLIKLKHAALNHRDVFIQQGLYPGIVHPVIPGSDGAGVIEEINGQSDLKAGDEVIICPNFDWGDNENCQSLSYSILGMPKQGTFAEQIVVPLKNVFSKPEHLSLKEAAALPLGALTAYRALFSRSGLKPNQKLLINGVGGGVATFALLFGLANGNEVYVTSGSAEKIDGALKLGAKGGFNYKDTDWTSQLMNKAGMMDVIVDSAGGEAFKQLLVCANFGGTIVTYGGTLGKIPNIKPQILFWKQLNILGSTMGSDQDFKDMLTFVNKHKIKPIISDEFPMEEGQAAFDLMDEGKQFGKIILNI